MKIEHVQHDYHLIVMKKEGAEEVKSLCSVTMVGHGRAPCLSLNFTIGRSLTKLQKMSCSFSEILTDQITKISCSVSEIFCGVLTATGLHYTQEGQISKAKGNVGILVNCIKSTCMIVFSIIDGSLEIPIQLSYDFESLFWNLAD